MAIKEVLIQVDLDDLREKLSVAGKMYDGHVTIGSLDEQLKVVKDFLYNLGSELYNKSIEAESENIH